MVCVDDDAPGFSAPLANGEVETVTLPEAIEEGPVDLYGVTMDFEGLGLEDLAKRAVFVVDTDGEVTYAWASDDPGVEPDYEEVEAVAATAA